MPDEDHGVQHTGEAMTFAEICHFLPVSFWQEEPIEFHFTASFKRGPILETGITSPVRPISPKAMSPPGRGMSFFTDTRARAMPRSAAVSLTRKPPATLRYTSSEEKGIRTLFPVPPEE